MNELNLSAAEAAGSPIHGLKHFLSTVATQLDFERNTIGNWATGTMVQKCLINTIRVNVFTN